MGANVAGVLKVASGTYTSASEQVFDISAAAAETKTDPFQALRLAGRRRRRSEELMEEPDTFVNAAPERDEVTGYIPRTRRLVTMKKRT